MQEFNIKPLSGLRSKFFSSKNSIKAQFAITNWELRMFHNEFTGWRRFQCHSIARYPGALKLAVRHIDTSNPAHALLRADNHRKTLREDYLPEFNRPRLGVVDNHVALHPRQRHLPLLYLDEPWGAT